MEISVNLHFKFDFYSKIYKCNELLGTYCYYHENKKSHPIQNCEMLHLDFSNPSL